MSEPLDLDQYLHQQSERWAEVVRRLEDIRGALKRGDDGVAYDMVSNYLSDCRRYADEAKADYDAF